MKISKKEFEKIKKLMPVERKPAKISNQQLLNALLYMVENGCKWRALPKKFGNWHTIYMRFKTALASRSIRMEPEPEKSAASKVLVAQKGANDEDTRGLCI